ncbi:AsnC family transcriptional regulator, partial [Vibrio parahaemolyticus]
MDRIDVKILERLQVDGRATLAELADIVGLSATT